MARESLASDFVVLKFGGTSVATITGWRTIADRIGVCLEEGLTPVVVHSALAGVSSDLHKTLDACTRDEHRPLIEKIRAQHLALAETLAVDGESLLREHFDTLARLSSGIALIGEVSPKQHARVLSLGELMASRIGHAWLLAQGVDVCLLDARQLLRSHSRPDRPPTDDYLNAVCHFAPDAPTRAHFDTKASSFLTQGFIASNNNGATVLLGRGGSDTTASYLAALISARRIEIWTDVAGLYSADPRLVPGARLLKRLDYAEAQEIATTGAKILHPRCLQPARLHDIPLYVKSTAEPASPGTQVSGQPGSTAPRLKAISARRGLTLVSMESSGMWQEVGFLARAFAVFARHQLSIDLISSSETSVTVSLDAPAAHLASGALEGLVNELRRFCQVRLLDRCAAISLVGRQVRAILHEVAPAFEVFREYDVYLVSQAANDLNFTFVVDQIHSDRLVKRLHDLLIHKGREDRVLGRSWAESHTPAPAERAADPPWWLKRRDQLLALAPADKPVFVYDRASIANAAKGLVGIGSVSRVFYSTKANNHPDILRAIDAEGLDFECVSSYELAHLQSALPGIAAERVLFTPNFAPRSEYEMALNLGVRITIDNRYVLEQWPELFAGREMLLRVDPGEGLGHHRYVQTAGKNSKFGIPLHEVEQTAQIARDIGAQIRGLHAHKGSGIVDAAAWAATARTLAGTAGALASVRYLNLGGGLGVPDSSGGAQLDLTQLDRHLAQTMQGLDDFELWLEPGRYVVAGSGVILSRVTQCKDKDGINYVGLNTGMNSLLRPALYGAYHEIVNLSRIDQRATQLVDIVGPICESADVLGSARMLPPTYEGDVMLIANTGAYGHVMSNHYNLRPPGEELVL